MHAEKKYEKNDKKHKTGNDQTNDKRMGRSVKKRRGARGTFLYRPLVCLARIAMRLLLCFRLEQEAEVRTLKKGREPFIVLVQHPSMLDAAVLFVSLLPRRVRAVAGRYQFVGKKTQKLFEWMDVIPKKQFYADVASVREMLATIKKGGVLAFMPEGCVSMDGTNHVPEPSTAAFLKKCAVPVVLLSTRGSYFVMPAWRSRPVSIGPVSARLHLLFSREALREKSVAQIRQELNDAFCYDQFAENARKRPRYFGRAKGISRILYRCRACGAIGSMCDDGKKVWCRDCGFRVYVRRDRFFDTKKQDAFRDVAQWNAWQLDKERTYWQKKDAVLAYPAACRTLNDAGASTAYSRGVLCLDHAGVSYSDRTGEDVFSRSLDRIGGVSAGHGKGNVTFCTAQGARVFTLSHVCEAAHFANALHTLLDMRDDAAKETEISDAGRDA